MIYFKGDVNVDNKNKYLECERAYVFELLMMVAGMMGAYTFILRGNVFCNAQTANFVMMASALGQGKWEEGFYFFIPITAYLMGAIISEMLPGPIKRHGKLRWDTLLLAIESVTLFAIGFIPLTLPHQIVQVVINFIASMQYNTFRQAEGVPMATTFCTNHVRQLGVGLAKYIRKGDKNALKRGLKHFKMILFFVLGGLIVAILCKPLAEKSIWIAIIPLMINFALLLHSDLVYEHGEFNSKPHGH